MQHLDPDLILNSLNVTELLGVTKTRVCQISRSLFGPHWFLQVRQAEAYLQSHVERFFAEVKKND